MWGLYDLAAAVLISLLTCSPFLIPRIPAPLSFSPHALSPFSSLSLLFSSSLPFSAPLFSLKVRSEPLHYPIKHRDRPPQRGFPRSHLQPKTPPTLEEHGDTRDRAALEIHDLLPATDRTAMLSHNQRCVSGVKKGKRRGIDRYYMWPSSCLPISLPFSSLCYSVYATQWYVCFMRFVILCSSSKRNHLLNASLLWPLHYNRFPYDPLLYLSYTS